MEAVMTRVLLSFLLMTIALPAVAAEAAKPEAAKAEAPKDEYPYRVRYPDVTIITTQDLAKRLKDVVVIDVRSKYEYETLHIKDAVLVELKTGFGDKILALRDKHKKPFVFYCNGKTCHKSYDAVLLATKARVDNLYAYDAGIFDWAKAQPDHTVLLGRSPIQPGDLIDSKSFKARLLEPKDFVARVGDKSVVLDVRDRRQRDTALFPFQEQRAQLSELKKIDVVIEQAKTQKKTLLVYDEVGKQVQWFQYYLERKGMKDYYFMKDGAQGHFNAMYGKVVLGGEDKAKKPGGAGSAKP
jgi:rhodanese-related sulfurtransferase